MKIILLKSLLVALGAMAASLALVSVVVPLLGGVVDGNAWLMCTICPLATAWPGSFHVLWQNEKLRRLHGQLAHAHAQLASAHVRLAEKASRDDMTGMLNRESFFAALDRTRGNADRGALLIIDADHFKQINDNFGHMAGDEALLEIATAISAALRFGDVVGRIGGEEFGAFLSGASGAVTRSVAERVRDAVEKIRFRPDGGQLVRLTVSIGGVGCPIDAGVTEMMRDADRKLYEAKHQGRNRVALAEKLALAVQQPLPLKAAVA